MAEEKEAPKPKERTKGEPISLHPLTLAEAVRGLLGVPPQEQLKGKDAEQREEHPPEED